MIEPRRYQRYVELLLAGEHEGCRREVQALLEQGVPVRELYLELFKASLYEVGDRWQRGELSVATEHVATAITEDLISLVFPSALSEVRCGRTAVVCCTPEEIHQLGGRIVADTLEMHGWDAHFLGANTSVEALLDAVATRSPDLVALSVSLRRHLPVAADTARRVRSLAPEVSVVVGGRALQSGGAEHFEGLPGVRVLGSLEALEALLEAWEAR